MEERVERMIGRRAGRLLTGDAERMALSVAVGGSSAFVTAVVLRCAAVRDAFLSFLEMMIWTDESTAGEDGVLISWLPAPCEKL